MRALQTEFVRSLIKLDKSAGEIEAWLLSQKVHPAVARDWGNEVTRREAMNKCAADRKDSHHYINKKYSGHRRILHRVEKNGREFFLHATKGWRHYRLQT